MIEIKDTLKGKTFLYYNDDEKQIAEEKMTEKIVLNIDLNLNECIKQPYHLILIPYVNYTGKYSHKEKIKIDDILTKENETYFAKKNKTLLNENIMLDLNKIPQEYNYLDLFVYPNTDLGIIGIKDLSLSIKKKVQSSYKLFSYTRNFEKNVYGIMLGTFGRIDSNGWKFYPQFYETLINKNKLLKLYLGESFFNKF